MSGFSAYKLSSPCPSANICFSTVEETKIVLASKSPRRKEILSRLNIPFICVIPEMTEITGGIHPPHIPFENARGKAESVAEKFPDRLILAADTVVELENLIIGKPKDMRGAERMLAALSGKTHRVTTAVCLRKISGNITCVFGDSTDVTFKKLNGAAVKKYLAQINPLDKAGAYAIQKRGNMLIQKISGSLDNVMGLPSEKLLKSLQSLGFLKVMTNLAPDLKFSS